MVQDASACVWCALLIRCQWTPSPKTDQSGSGVCLAICERLWLRLIGSTTGHNIRWGSGQFCTVVPQFTKRKEQKSFSKTSRNDAVPDRTPLLLPGLTPSPDPPTSRKNRPVLLSHRKQQPLTT